MFQDCQEWQFLSGESLIEMEVPFLALSDWKRMAVECILGWMNDRSNGKGLISVTLEVAGLEEMLEILFC